MKGQNGASSLAWDGGPEGFPEGGMAEPRLSDTCGVTS